MHGVRFPGDGQGIATQQAPDPPIWSQVVPSATSPSLDWPPHSCPALNTYQTSAQFLVSPGPSLNPADASAAPLPTPPGQHSMVPGQPVPTLIHQLLQLVPYPASI
jgi:hypothetical protein